MTRIPALTCFLLLNAGKLYSDDVTVYRSVIFRQENYFVNISAYPLS